MLCKAVFLNPVPNGPGVCSLPGLKSIPWTSGVISSSRLHQHAKAVPVSLCSPFSPQYRSANTNIQSSWHLAQAHSGYFQGPISFPSNASTLPHYHSHLQHSYNEMLTRRSEKVSPVTRAPGAFRVRETHHSHITPSFCGSSLIIRVGSLQDSSDLSPDSWVPVSALVHKHPTVKMRSQFP